MWLVSFAVRPVRRTAQILTNVVATESGNTAAVIANAAVVAAEAPSASTMRIVKDRAMKSRCLGTRSSNLKTRPQGAPCSFITGPCLGDSRKWASNKYTHFFF